MSHRASGQRHWLALGVGLLVLVAGISSSLWLLQRDDGPAPVLGANESAPGASGSAAAVVDTGPDSDEEGVKELPASSANDSGPALVAAEDGDAGGVVPGFPDKETTAPSRAAGANLGTAQDGGGAAVELPALTQASLSELAELEVQRGAAPPPRGGPGAVAQVQDTAEIVVRDASGKVKQREVVK